MTACEAPPPRPPAAYRVSLPRYYSAPERPLRFTPLPLPTFCTATDVAHHAIPVLVLAGEPPPLCSEGARGACL